MDDYELDMMEAEQELFGFNPETVEQNPCSACTGEDCICCSVYLEQRAEQRGW